MYVRWFEKRKKRFCSKQLEEELNGLYPGVSRRKQVKDYYRKKFENAIKLGLIGIVFVVLCVFKRVMNSDLKEMRYLEREPVGGETKEIALDVKVGDEEYENVIATVGAREISKEEKRQIFEGLAGSLEEIMIGENKSADYVTHPLNLITEWEDTDISIYWTSSNYGVLKEDGSFGTDEIPKTGTKVELKAYLSWEEMGCEKAIEVTVFPQQKTLAEMQKEDLVQLIRKKEESSRTEQYLELPDYFQGNELNWRVKKRTSLMWLPLVPIVLVFAGMWGMDRDLHQQYKERNRQLLLEYSEFVSKLQLLIGAGLSVRNAFVRLSSDYQKRKNMGGRKRFVYEEVMMTVRRMENGESEEEAYDYFAKKCTLVCYRKLMSIILQNQKKGAEGLKESLEVEIRNAFEERKQEARRLGEEAGTKLLLPMMLMMGVVLMIIVTPAYFSFGGI